MKMIRFIREITPVISLIAIALSCIALFTTHPRGLGIDYLGWIVGVLALLVTFLLGWNIYSMIDIKENQKTYLAIINEVDISQHKVLAIQEHTNWMIYHKLLLGKDPISLEYRFLYHALSCLYHTAYIRDYETCNVIIKGINECLESPDKVRMKKNNKDNLLSIIEKVPHKGQIAGYSEALSKILQIQVY